MPWFGSKEDEFLQHVVEGWKRLALESFYMIEACRQFGYGYSGYGGDPAKDWKRDRFTLWANTSSLVEALALDYPNVDPRPIQAVYSAAAMWHDERDDENVPEQARLENLIEQALIACNVLEAGIRRRMTRERPAWMDVPDPRGEPRDNAGVAPVPDYERPVVLAGRGHSPIVLGHRKPALTDGQHDVVEDLIEAGDDGRDQLELESISPSARAMIRDLIRDPDWRAVIRKAGKKGGRYRIVDPRKVDENGPE